MVIEGIDETPLVPVQLELHFPKCCRGLIEYLSRVVVVWPLVHMVWRNWTANPVPFSLGVVSGDGSGGGGFFPVVGCSSALGVVSGDGSCGGAFFPVVGSGKCTTGGPLGTIPGGGGAST